eukprot:GHVL01040051.1.p1 GENE.GHVL01040051.1~~GHVL01040051.1.p1  ORF type:complete len:112 (-),score=21.28 GHVL01040051.1:26-361(-)
MVMGMSAAETENTDIADLVDERTFKLLNFRIRAKHDTYQDELKIKYQVQGCEPVNFAKETEAFNDTIRHLYASLPNSVAPDPIFESILHRVAPGVSRSGGMLNKKANTDFN